MYSGVARVLKRDYGEYLPYKKEISKALFVYNEKENPEKNENERSSPRHFEDIPERNMRLFLPFAPVFNVLRTNFFLLRCLQSKAPKVSRPFPYIRV